MYYVYRTFYIQNVSVDIEYRYTRTTIKRGKGRINKCWKIV